MRTVLIHLLLLVSLLLTTGCEGAFGWIYDEPEAIEPAEGKLVIDATSWTDWYYVNLADQSVSAAYAIPMAGGEATTLHPDGHPAGNYLYWFDVWGEGLSRNAFREFVPTAEQPEPEAWSFAVHRNNVRTNGGAVYETTYTDINALPASPALWGDKDFVSDEWTETAVWCSQERILQALVPSQGIAINKALSGWIRVDIPPIPPAFSHNNHVFVLRLKDGTYAALQLADYLSPTGAKCYLTINYRYPL